MTAICRFAIVPLPTRLRAILITTISIFWKGIILLLLANALTATAYAQGGFYGVTSLGYVSNDIKTNTETMTLDAMTYKLSIGYELNDSWNIEGGYQALGENMLDMDELNLDNASQEITSIFISAIGRAGNRNGELFYRLGLMRVDISETYLSAVSCPNNGNLLAMQESLLLCQNSSSKLAGTLGLGFDFYIHHSSLLRIEIEQVKGQDDYEALAAYIGIRLNF